MIIVFFIFFELASLPALAIWSATGIPVNVRTVLITATLFVLYVAVTDRFLKIMGMNYCEIGVELPKKEDLKKNILLWFLGTIVCIAWLLIYLGTFKMLLPVEYARIDALKYTGYLQSLSEWGKNGGFYGATALWGGMLLLTAAEELAFRGLIFSYLKRKYSLKEALIWSSALFSLAHLNLYSFPITFVLGLIFALLYKKSGGLAVPISVHLAYNLSLVYFGKLL